MRIHITFHKLEHKGYKYNIEVFTLKQKQI
jgi:hypothetical protein